eukprot:COSAG05_NODE_11423_length_514_cov_0.773494_1_plen_143_part_01
MEAQRRRDAEVQQRVLAAKYGGGGVQPGLDRNAPTKNGEELFPSLPSSASAPKQYGWGSGLRTATEKKQQQEQQQPPSSQRGGDVPVVNVQNQELFPSLGPASAPRVAPLNKHKKALAFFSGGGGASSSSSSSRSGGIEAYMK